MGKINDVINDIKTVSKIKKNIDNHIYDICWNIIDKINYNIKRELRIAIVEYDIVFPNSYCITRFGKIKMSYKKLKNILENMKVKPILYRCTSFDYFPDIDNEIYDEEDWNGYNACIEEFDVIIDVNNMRFSINDPSGCIK